MSNTTIMNYTKEIVLENDYGSIWHYPELKLVHHQFHKFTFGFNFRRILKAGAEVFEQKKCNKWLSDDRKIPVIPTDDMDWAKQEWDQRILDSGWKYWATILPNNEIGRKEIQQLINKFERHNVVNNKFDDETNALNWLSALD